jgi:hypothetical protein
MLKGMKKARILFALIISLSAPILSGYFLYCDLAGDNPFSSDARCENPDVDDLFSVPNCKNQLKFSASMELNDLFPVFLLETNAFEQVSPFCSPLSRLEQKNLVLRC